MLCAAAGDGLAGTEFFSVIGNCVPMTEKSSAGIACHQRIEIRVDKKE